MREVAGSIPGPVRPENQYAQMKSVGVGASTTNPTLCSRSRLSLLNFTLARFHVTKVLLM